MGLIKPKINLRVAFVSLVSTRSVVPESTATDRVEDDDEHENTGIDHSKQPPLFPDVGQNPGLARLAVVAQHRLVVTPRRAITVGHCWARFRDCPEGCILELQSTVRWWLAATRLGGRQVSLVEISNSFMRIPSEPRTNMGINQTTLNLIPIRPIHHIHLQPIGVIPEPVLLIPSPRYGLPYPLIRNQYRENRETHQCNNEQEHHNQVNP